MSDDEDRLLAEFLQQRGHSEDEVAKIAKRLAEHDAESMRESIFDSIAGGTFSIDDIIKQALKGE
jgi:transposase